LADWAIGQLFLCAFVFAIGCLSSCAALQNLSYKLRVQNSTKYDLYGWANNQMRKWMFAQMRRAATGKLGNGSIVLLHNRTIDRLVINKVALLSCSAIGQ
jgi:hypothetical protein